MKCYISNVENHVNCCKYIVDLHENRLNVTDVYHVNKEIKKKNAYIHK